MKINSLQEYRDFVQQHNIPLDTIRFALGEDKGHEPRWFYIYQDRFTGEWVVAKNKSDGSTAERYRGNDEAKACQILFDKMEEEFNNRQFKSPQDTEAEREYKKELGKRRAKSRFVSALQSTAMYAVFIVILGFIVQKTLGDEPSSAVKRPGQGYYVFEHTYDDGSVWDDLYYYLDNIWYYYDDEYDDWYVDDDFDYSYDYVDDYYVGNYYSSLDGYYDGDAWDFDDTTYYQLYQDSLNDRNDNYNNDSYDSNDNYDSWDSYDWDDWDSNDSDWDSDW